MNKTRDTAKISVRICRGRLTGLLQFLPRR